MSVTTAVCLCVPEVGPVFIHSPVCLCFLLTAETTVTKLSAEPQRVSSVFEISIVFCCMTTGIKLNSRKKREQVPHDVIIYVRLGIIHIPVYAQQSHSE